MKETFDDNLLLQDVTTNAFKESFITTMVPRVGMAYKPDARFGIDLSYSPEVNIIHSSTEEDFVTHRVGLTLGGRQGKTSWEVAENFVWIDGSEEGPSFFGPGGPPAAGAPQIRDRREAVIQRGTVKVRRELGDWFVRPAAMGYLHDFRAEHRATPGYQNYVDRDEWNVGFDIGAPFISKSHLVAGYRYGQQKQAELLNSPIHYDNSYHRALAGVEGKPWTWFQVAISAGPEFRRYDDSVTPGFEKRNEVYLYADATISILPSKSDTIAISAKRFEQPGFGGRSAYIDGTYDLLWKHKIGPKLTLGAGIRGYQTEFLEPVLRNDWIVSPNAVISYSLTKDLTFETSYVFDRAYSLVSNTEGREYTRHAVALGVRYVIK